MSEWLDLGSGVWASFFVCRHSEGEPAGALIRFGGAEGDPGYDRDDVCVGGINWCADCPGATWTLHSLDPLHVEPSIQTNCHKHVPSHHGWIREGRWISV